MKYIKLTKGKYTKVDDEDYEELNQYKWCYDSVHGYAVRNGYPNKSLIKMHRQIMNEPESKEVDHKDLDKLNNQKHNLRLATRAQNGFNKKAPKNNTSGFKGVHYHNTGWRLSRPWRARIAITTKDGRKDIHLGFFPTPQEAAKAWNKAALKYHGEFARLNEI